MPATRQLTEVHWPDSAMRATRSLLCSRHGERRSEVRARSGFPPLRLCVDHLACRRCAWVGRGGRSVGRVQFGLIVPENPENPPGRTSYLAGVERLIAAVAGQYDSVWCIDHLQGDVLEG